MSFIPGMFPRVAGARRLTALSVVNQTQVGTQAAFDVGITIPTVQDGDLLVLLTYAGDGVNQLAAFAAITGWTTVVTAEYPTIKRTASSLHFKIATAADSGTVVTGGCTGNDTGAGRSKVKMLLVVRGDVPITSAVAGSATGEASLGNPAAQTVTLSGGAAPLFVVGGYATAGLGQTVATRTCTVSGVGAKDSEYQEALFSDLDIWLAWKSFNAGSSLATPVVVDMGTAGSSNLLSGYIACT